jgi:hypothetical protein
VPGGATAQEERENDHDRNQQGEDDAGRPRDPARPPPPGTSSHWAEFGRGGHFAAMEVPDLLVGDVRDFFRRFR